MTPEAARRLVLQLTSAFAFPHVPDPTAELYFETLVGLDEQIAAEVIQGIVRTEERWPPLGLVLAAYRRRLTWYGDQRAKTHGLPEPRGSRPPAPGERPPVPDSARAWLERQRVVVADHQSEREVAERRAIRALFVWQDTTDVAGISPPPRVDEESAT